MQSALFRSTIAAKGLDDVDVPFEILILYLLGDKIG
jgi:hypothetical protein